MLGSFIKNNYNLIKAFSILCLKFKTVSTNYLILLFTFIEMINVFKKQLNSNSIH